MINWFGACGQNPRKSTLGKGTPCISVYSYFLHHPPSLSTGASNGFPLCLMAVDMKERHRFVEKRANPCHHQNRAIGWTGISAMLSEAAWLRDEGRHQEVSSSISNRKQWHKETHVRTRGIHSLVVPVLALALTKTNGILLRP